MLLQQVLSLRVGPQFQELEPIVKLLFEVRIHRARHQNTDVLHFGGGGEKRREDFSAGEIEVTRKWDLIVL